MVTLILLALSSAHTKPLAVATMESKSDSKVVGTVEFFDQKMTVKMENLTPGKHGFHIHEKGDCSAPDAASAGGHFNPKGAKHAGLSDKERHSGDLGNITVGPDGKVKTDVAYPFDKEFVGKSVVVHEAQDDLNSQPAGNSGKRIGCGVIKVAP